VDVGEIINELGYSLSDMYEDIESKMRRMNKSVDKWFDDIVFIVEKLNKIKDLIPMEHKTPLPNPIPSVFISTIKSKLHFRLEKNLKQVIELQNACEFYHADVMLSNIEDIAEALGRYIDIPQDSGNSIQDQINQLQNNLDSKLEDAVNRYLSLSFEEYLDNPLTGMYFKFIGGNQVNQKQKYNDAWSKLVRGVVRKFRKEVNDIERSPYDTER
jgi:ABC-type Fe3+-hydroxamate transport system substrate-binding protein